MEKKDILNYSKNIYNKINLGEFMLGQIPLPTKENTKLFETIKQIAASSTDKCGLFVAGIINDKYCFLTYKNKDVFTIDYGNDSINILGFTEYDKDLKLTSQAKFEVPKSSGCFSRLAAIFGGILFGTTIIIDYSAGDQNCGGCFYGLYGLSAVHMLPYAIQKLNRLRPSVRTRIKKEKNYYELARIISKKNTESLEQLTKDIKIYKDHEENMILGHEPLHTGFISCEPDSTYLRGYTELELKVQTYLLGGDALKMHKIFNEVHSALPISLK